MATTLRIATWNANGLLQHIPELEVFLGEDKVDICLIFETYFTESSYIKIRGYHTPHPLNKPRGSAILIKNNILHFEKPKISNPMMQVTTICIRVKNKDFKISAIYCPPRHTPRKNDYIELLRTLGNNFILGGDFNAKHKYWGSRLTTNKGRELYQAGKELKCDFISTGKPTHWPTDPNYLT